jgi:hypothetical protein
MACDPVDANPLFFAVGRGSVGQTLFISSDGHWLERIEAISSLFHP